MKTHCSHDKMVLIKDLKPHPKNPNKHDDFQVERLAKVLAYQGWRSPILVSNTTGYITAGHGRILAAKHLGLKEVPVNFQNYDDWNQEYSHVVSDNAIAAWAELDMSMVNVEVPELGPEFDLEMLGFKDFKLDSSEIEGEIKEKELDENLHTDKECPSCGYKW